MTGEPTVLGRWPAVAKITPSNPSPWYGSIPGAERHSGSMRGGTRFTTEQQAAIVQRGLSTADVPAMVVRRRATMAEAWWPQGSPAPLYEFECPIVGHRADGRRLVITPAGMAKLVQCDGWITAPRRASGRIGR